jgi:hypothetical protein
MTGKRAAKRERTAAKTFAERLEAQERTSLLESAIMALVKHGGGRIVVPAIAVRGLGPRDSLCIEVTDEGIVLRYALDGELYEGKPEPEAG